MVRQITLQWQAGCRGRLWILVHVCVMALHVSCPCKCVLESAGGVVCGVVCVASSARAPQEPTAEWVHSTQDSALGTQHSPLC